MRFAYADPPYVGHTKRGRYKHDPRATEVDHADLIAQLELGAFDGWALSCSSPSLRSILPLCPADTRVMAWVKPFCSFKPGVNPAYAWEPVLVRGGRKRERFEPTVRDWCSVNIVLKKGLVGAKPPDFCRWLFDVLGMRPGDELVDWYPGTGAVSAAWSAIGVTQAEIDADLAADGDGVPMTPRTATSVARAPMGRPR